MLVCYCNSACVSIAIWCWGYHTVVLNSTVNNTSTPEETWDKDSRYYVDAIIYTPSTPY